jgi:hypothetical protein
MNTVIKRFLAALMAGQAQAALTTREPYCIGFSTDLAVM